MGKGGSKIPVEELNTLMANTHFDSKELKQWYQGFIKDCPDGQLNKEQFAELYCGFYDSNNAGKFSEHVFRTFDVNGDGKIGELNLKIHSNCLGLKVNLVTLMDSSQSIPKRPSHLFPAQYW